MTSWLNTWAGGFFFGAWAASMVWLAVANRFLTRAIARLERVRKALEARGE